MTEGMNRMEELMSSYYGMEKEEEVEVDSSDINGSEFSVDDYMKNLLQTDNLTTLLEKNDGLVHEIKTLDSDLQMLVYENYNKFLSATDSIRKMKQDVESMESEMDQVVQGMQSVTHRSRGVHESLCHRRQKVERLVGVRRLLQRLEFLFHLPQHLNECIQKEKYVQAAKYYRMANQILQRYAHIASFSSIQSEAEKIQQQLIELLQAKLESPDASPNSITEAVQILLDLNHDKERLCEAFLQWNKTHLKNMIDVQCGNDNVVQSIEALNESFLEHYTTAAQSFHRLFLQTEEEELVHEKVFQQFTKTVFASYFSACSGLFSNASIHLMESWTVFLQDIAKVDRAVPRLHLSDRAVEVVEASVRTLLTDAFQELREKVVDLILKVHQQASELVTNDQSPDSNVVSQSTQELCQLVHFTLQQIKPFLKMGAETLAEMTQVFSHLAQSQFLHFLEWFNTTMADYALPRIVKNLENSSTLETFPEFLYLLSCIGYHFGTDGVTKCIKHLYEIVPSTNHMEQLTGGIDSARWIGSVQESGQKVLVASIRLRGLQLTRFIRQSLGRLQQQQGLSSSPPRSVRPSMEDLVHQVAKSYRFWSILLGQNAKTNVYDFRRAMVSNALSSELERMFSTCLQDSVEFSLESIAAALWRVVLKGWIEFLRLEYLTPTVYHQLQADLEFLRLVIPRFVDNNAILENLLAQALFTAKQRSGSVAPLQQSVVAAIVSTTTAQFQIEL